MKIDHYLLFDGNCGEAFDFYQQTLGGKIDFTMTFAESPMAKKTPPEWQGKILHTSMSLGNVHIMASDAQPEHFHKPQGFSISLSFDSLPETERVFNALAANGTVKMPLQKTFWSECFGMLSDQFGIPWMVGFENAPETSA